MHTLSLALLLGTSYAGGTLALAGFLRRSCSSCFLLHARAQRLVGGVDSCQQPSQTLAGIVAVEKAGVTVPCHAGQDTDGSSVPGRVCKTQRLGDRCREGSTWEVLLVGQHQYGLALQWLLCQCGS
jgi:hypothetical protein